MANSRGFKPPPKKQKSKPVADLQTEDDFLQAADFEEETAGKWRAGDSAKCARAYVRALEIYDKGIQRYPNSCDLAYNKGQILQVICEQPVVVAHLGLRTSTLLEQALGSYRSANRNATTEPEVIHILFNTAQVLTSLAEILIEDDAAADQPILLLREAFDYFLSCLERQESEMELQLEAQAKFNLQFGDTEGGVRVVTWGETPVRSPASDRTDSTSYTEERRREAVYAEQPVTHEDRLETIHAAYATLTTIVPLLDQQALQDIAGMAQKLYEGKVPISLAQVSLENRPKAEFTVALDRAVFVAALADAQYNLQLIDLATYIKNLDSFDFKDKDQDDSALSAEGDARLELAYSMFATFADSPDMPADVCWRQLSLAQEAYTKAAKLKPSSEVYVARGDVEMCRHRLSISEYTQLSQAVRKSAPALMQNAQTYYRGAIKLVDQSDGETKSKIERRVSVATALRATLYQVELPGGTNQFGDLLKAGLVECVEDDLMSASFADGIASQMNLI